jgi:hypothetical protein
LATLLRDWESVAVPSYSRYVRRPAVTNEGGVVSVPPPVTDLQLVALAGPGALALLGTLLTRRRTRTGLW